MKLSEEQQRKLKSLFTYKNVIDGFKIDCVDATDHSFTLQVSKIVEHKSVLYKLMEEWMESESLGDLYKVYLFMNNQLEVDMSLTPESVDEKMALRVLNTIYAKCEHMSPTLEEEVLYRTMMFEIYRLLFLFNLDASEQKQVKKQVSLGKCRKWKSGKPLFHHQIQILTSVCKLLFSNSQVMYEFGCKTLFGNRFFYDVWMYVISTPIALPVKTTDFLKKAADLYFRNECRDGLGYFYGNGNLPIEEKVIAGKLIISSISDLRAIMSPRMIELMEFISLTEQQFVNMFLEMLGNSWKDILSENTKWASESRLEDLLFVVKKEDRPAIYFTFPFVTTNL